jgi:putative FmdB family regulatory protein
MPIYAYRCSKCGDEIEVMQSMTDAPLKRCKKCRGALKRVFHPVGIAFKGSGFYKTDSRGHKRASDEAKSSRDDKPTKTEPAAKSTGSDSKSSSAAD